jgi:hypothetical protein
MLIIPDDELITVSNLNENNNELDFRNIIKSLFFPIFLFALYIFLLLLFISLFEKNSNKKHLLSSNYENPFYYLRNLDEESNNIIDKTDNRKLIKEIITNVDYVTYEGKWYNKNSFVSNGILFMHFIMNRDIGSEYLNIVIRLIEGVYINNWRILYMQIPIKQLKVNNIKNKSNQSQIINFKGYSDSDVEIGEYFNKKKSYLYCKSLISLNFTLFENDTINYKKDINGELNSTCKEFDKYEIKIEEKNTESESILIKSYSKMIVILCILMIINTNIVKYRLNDSEGFANGISLIIIFENIIWNSYGCLIHFFLTLYYPKYVYEFAFPTITFFFNFSFTDLRFLYCIWRLKNQKHFTDQVLIKKKLLKLFGGFYLLMFFSLLFAIKFLFYKPFILIGILLTWTPQIIYNIYYNNKISLPWSYVLFTSFYKLFIPCYFRLNKKNFFLIPPDFIFSIFIILLMFFQIYILYSQQIKGSRFFLPKKYINQGFNFYKTKEEMLNLLSDSEIKNLECVICLNPLFSEENENSNFRSINNDFVINERSQINSNQIITNNNYNPIYYWYQIIISFFEFSERSLNVEGKKYMITPCNHFFHSKCLELWFKRKRKCPNCRREIKFNA